MNASKAVAKNVGKIIARVVKEGDRALAAYSRRFDGVRLAPSGFFVGRERMARGWKRCAPGVKEALKTAKARIEKFHKEEFRRLPKDWAVVIDGVKVGQTARPLAKVGLYAPGGRTCYPSTVLMTTVPAKIAGVKEIILATPMKNLKDEVLAA